MCTRRKGKGSARRDSSRQFHVNLVCIDYYQQPNHTLRQHNRLSNMYKAYERRKEIIIWCHPTTTDKRKQRSDNEIVSSSSKRAKCAEKNEEAMDEVKTLVLQLQERHGSRYTAELYNAWAQLIHLKKHMMILQIILSLEDEKRVKLLKFNLFQQTLLEKEFTLALNY